LLRGQQIDGVVAVRLVEPHHVRARRKHAFPEAEGRGRAPYLDALCKEPRDELRHACRIALPVGNQEAEGRVLESAGVGVQALEVVVVQQLRRLLRHVIESREQRRLVVVDVVARRPEKAPLLRRGQRSVPFDRGVLTGLLRDEGLGGAVAEGLVAAAIRVVIGRDGIEIEMSEVVAEVPGPHARHAESGERLHLVEAQLQTLVVGERVDVLVDRPGAVPGHEQRHALVHVVDHLRMPGPHHAEHGLGGRVHLLVRIAVDVDKGVFRPVGRCLPRQPAQVGPALEIAVEPFDLLVAAVGIGDRVDEHHELLANAPDQRLLRNREAIGELERRLGGAALIGVQPGVDVVDRAGGGDELLGGFRVGAARIGERRRGRLEPLEIADPLLVGDRQQHDVAALLRAADAEEADPRRGAGERPAVAVSRGRVGQLARGSRDAVPVGARRDHARRSRQVAHPGRDEAGLRGGTRDFLDRAGLGRLGRRRDPGAEQRRSEHQHGQQPEPLVAHEPRHLASDPRREPEYSRPTIEHTIN
jgi:hypothetical protein